MEAHSNDSDRTKLAQDYKFKVKIVVMQAITHAWSHYYHYFLITDPLQLHY